jgi:hypothetical protein
MMVLRWLSAAVNSSLLWIGGGLVLAALVLLPSRRLAWKDPERKLRASQLLFLALLLLLLAILVVKAAG